MFFLDCAEDRVINLSRDPELTKTMLHALEYLNMFEMEKLTPDQSVAAALVLYLTESTVGNLPESEEATKEYQVHPEIECTKMPEQRVQLKSTSPKENKPSNQPSPKLSQRTSQPSLPSVQSSPSS